MGEGADRQGLAADRPWPVPRSARRCVIAPVPRSRMVRRCARPIDRCRPGHARHCRRRRPPAAWACAVARRPGDPWGVGHGRGHRRPAGGIADHRARRHL